MTQTGGFAIETHSLSKSFGPVPALKSVDLAVPHHSIFGFLGPNGAGKTTLMKILLGLVHPTSGKVTIFGRDVVGDGVATRERIGYLPQNPSFIEYMTARENLVFTAGFFFSGPPAKVLERCDQMLGLAGLADKANRPIHGFSGGEKQRLGIALAQINDPDLLILDEPASALDPLGRQEVLEVMQRLRAHTTIFYSTHILDDVQRVSDRVAILNRGQLVACGPIEQILNGRDGVSYIIVVKSDPAGLGEQLSALPWVTQAVAAPGNGSTIWHVSVSDEAAAEAHLLRHVLADEQIVVTDFSRKKFELEEVFIDIIKGGSNGHE